MNVLGSIVVRQGCIISSWLFNRCSDEGVENRDGEEGNEISGGGNREGIVWPLVCR